jgi:ABC-type multidrug transport system fused ATPase/permease subunit
MTGKSTLIKLLTRLFDPTEGEILINDVDIKNYNLDELHDKMSVLFQDYRTLLPPQVI